MGRSNSFKRGVQSSPNFVGWCKGAMGLGWRRKVISSRGVQTGHGSRKECKGAMVFEGGGKG